MAVTNSFAAFPPLVPTPTIAPTASELAGMGDDVASAANDCRIAWVSWPNDVAPVKPGMTPPLAVPMKVRLVPVNVISPVPDVFVAPVSKLMLWPTDRTAEARHGSADPLRIAP